MQSSFTILHSLLYLESCCDGIWRNHLRESVCVTSTSSDDFLQRQLDERIGFRSRWKQQRHPTNPTTTKNPIIKNGETRGWTRIHQGDRERYLVWSQGHQALNKNGETRRWIKKSTQSCVSMPIKSEEEYQTRTVRPVGGQQSTDVEELDVDFTVPGWSHRVVKEAEYLRVQELEIESHPH